MGRRFEDGELSEEDIKDWRGEGGLPGGRDIQAESFRKDLSKVEGGRNGVLDTRNSRRKGLVLYVENEGGCVGCWQACVPVVWS